MVYPKDFWGRVWLYPKHPSHPLPSPGIMSGRRLNFAPTWKSWRTWRRRRTKRKRRIVLKVTRLGCHILLINGFIKTVYIIWILHGTGTKCRILGEDFFNRIGGKESKDSKVSQNICKKIIQNIEEVVFKFFWGGFWGLWENQRGSFILCFITLLWLGFWSLWRGCTRCPPLPCCIYDSKILTPKFL